MHGRYDYLRLCRFACWANCNDSITYAPWPEIDAEFTDRQYPLLIDKSLEIWQDRSRKAEQSGAAGRLAFPADIAEALALGIF